MSTIENPIPQRALIPSGFNNFHNDLKLCFFEIQKRRTEMQAEFNGVFPFALCDYELAKVAFWQVCKLHAAENKLRYANGFFVDPSLKRTLPNLVKWLIFDTEGDYDISKGLLLHGAIGRGKTELIKVIRKFILITGLKERQFSFTSINEIASYVNLDNGLLKDIYFFESNNCCFDNFLFNVDSAKIEKEIFDTRKELDKFTIITSRHTPETLTAFLELENTEGFNDMFNFVEFTV